MNIVPTTPLSFLEYADLVSTSILLVVVTGLVWSYYRKHGNLRGSISETIAQDKNSRLVFSIVLTILIPLYYSFVWFWVGPLVGMPAGFYVLLAISAVCEMTFAWIPATTGFSRKIHMATANFVGIVMFLSALLFLISSSNLSKIGAVAAIVFLLVSFLLLALLIFRKMRKHTITFEIIYCLVFLAFMSIVAHA